MERDKALLVAGAGGLVLVLFCAGWRLGRGPGGRDGPVEADGGGTGEAGRGVAATQTATAAATEPVYPPARFHANVMIEDPFPGRPELSPTRVSVDVENEPARLAVARVVDAAGTALGPSAAPPDDLMHAGRPVVVRGGPLLPDRAPPGQGVDTELPISLHLRNQPLLEALYQIQAQAPVTFSLAPSTGMIARYVKKSGEPMPWSIAGPFVEVIEKIERARSGMRPLGVGEVPGDLCSVSMRFYTEPRIRILTYPRLIDVTVATNEQGVSLIAPRVVLQQTQPETMAFPATAWLSLPRENPGQMIKTLRGRGRFSVEGPDPMPTVTLEDPLNVTPVTKQFAGMAIMFEKPVWNKLENGFDMGVTYTRGQYQGDWDAFAEAVGGVKPRAVQGTGRAAVSRAMYSTVTGASVKITYGIQLALVLDGKQVGNLDTAPAVESFTFDMPVGALLVMVPVEFRDLAMP